jgi:hypothetical protein
MFHFNPSEEVMEPLWREIGDMLGGGKCRGYFPASIFMATRR